MNHKTGNPAEGPRRKNVRSITNSRPTEKNRAERLINEIETEIGKMIADRVNDPTTDYTNDTARIVVAQMMGRSTGFSEAAKRLGIPAEDALVVSALRKGSLN